MKNILLILATSFFTACSPSVETNQQFYNIEARAEFSILNSDNIDLLDPKNSVNLDASKFKIFYQNNEVNNQNSDYPKGFRIYKHEKEYRIVVFLNHSEAEEKSTTYIHWNDNDIDKVEVSYLRSNNGVIQNVIWLNGNKVWERGNNTIDPYFVLRK